MLMNISCSCILHYRITFLACGCHTQGSNSTECDSSGKCSCKANVINDKCTACKSEYFGFPDCKGNFIQNTYSKITHIIISNL